MFFLRFPKSWFRFGTDNATSTTKKMAVSSSADSETKKSGKIWITRHGDRLDNVDYQWHRKLKNCSLDDTPLSDKGRIQANELAARLKDEHMDHIVSSPFQRCVETAHILGETLKVPVKLEPGICEVLWDYPPGFKTPSELKEQFSSVDLSYKYVLMPPGEESYDSDCFERVGETVLKIRKMYQGSLLFVGHGASVAGMLKAFTGRAKYVGYCTLTCLEKDGKLWKANYIGNADHLSDKRNLNAF